MTEPATQKASSPSSRGFHLLGFVALILLVSILISVGVLPVSCGRHLPFVGERYRELCDECQGDGSVAQTCSTCHGRGYFAGKSCAKCAGKGRVEQTCPYCAGSGKKPPKQK